MRNIENIFGSITVAPKQTPYTYIAVGGETSITIPFAFVSFLLSINSGVQTPGNAYAVSGNTVQLADIAEAGDEFYFLFDTVWSPKDGYTDYMTERKYTAPAAETQYTPGVPFSGVMVYINGSAKYPGDYFNTDGTTIKWINPMVGGEKVYIVLKQPSVWLTNYQLASDAVATYVPKTSLSASDGPKLIGRCSDVTSMRSVEPSVNGQRIDVIAYSPGWAGQVYPLGGGYFYYDATDVTTADDGVVCFVTTGGKRWKRIFGGFVTPEMAGAICDGITDDTVPLQKSLAYCSANYCDLNLLGKDYYTTGNLVYNFRKHNLFGNNATIFVSQDTTPVMKLLGHTNTTTPLAKSAAYEMKGVNFFNKTGNSSTGGVRTCLYIGDPTLDCAGARISSSVISGFVKGVEFGSNSYIHSFAGVSFTRCATNVYFPNGLSNSGEQLNFKQCTFSNSAANIYAGGNCVINLDQCSLDYSPAKITATAGGIVKANNCWFEGNDDKEVWVTTTGSLSTVLLNNCTFVLTGARTKLLFLGDSNTDGGIVVDTPMIVGASAAYTPTTYGGVGTFFKGSPIYRRAGLKEDLPFSTSMNMVVSPTFNLNLTGMQRTDLSIRAMGSSPTTRNETTSNNGLTYNPSSGYLLVQPPVGKVSRLSRTMLCSPGASVVASIDVLNSFSNSSDTLTLNLYFRNVSGVVINSFTRGFNSTSANTVSSPVSLLRGTGAPAGTAFVEFEVVTNTALDGNTYHQLTNYHFDVFNGGLNFPYETHNSAGSGFLPTVYGSTTEGSATYTSQEGTYTLVGNLVTFNINCAWTGHTGVGRLKISGLPYLSDFPANEVFAVYPEGFTTTTPLYARMDTYANTMLVYAVSYSGTLTPFDLPASGRIRMSGTYRRG